MKSVEFVTMIDRRAEPEVLRMMRELYDTDAPDLHVNPDHFPKTIHRLLADPSRGRILLFMRGEALCGYALLIPFWSNEFGGTLLFVDELFVDEACRGQGIAHAFFAFLAAQPPFDAVALALEVAPRNARARALYESMGFHERHHRMMTRRLTTATLDLPGLPASGDP
jgi:GNAT superfamily N-acetyltransferase